ncbi:hypothetical protein [Caenispirillum bisanense]|uniref:Uncharacterized protein n=1 Tax=Caenispirillum bisanense TaxID=414052 RepID=A0A286GTF0_9PROT|nr:hypothetical protein [Caenispirillum bisanense]SOD98800.1 hypothetical protein SAMN05421508_10889 [Caenispirillum bisanense]
MSNADATITFPVTRTIDIGVNLVEDRLVLVAHTQGHGRRLVLLTRRMLRVLLAHVTQVLETTGTVARTPGEHRVEVLQMEHQGALTAVQAQDPGQAGTAAAGEAAPEEEPASAFLAVEIKVRASATHLLVGFIGLPLGGTPAAGVGAAAEPACAMTLDRGDTHRVLALLHDKAKLAAWNLEAPSAWMQATTVDASPSRPAN